MKKFLMIFTLLLMVVFSLNADTDSDIEKIKDRNASSDVINKDVFMGLFFTSINNEDIYFVCLAPAIFIFGIPVALDDDIIFVYLCDTIEQGFDLLYMKHSDIQNNCQFICDVIDENKNFYKLYVNKDAKKIKKLVESFNK